MIRSKTSEEIVKNFIKAFGPIVDMNKVFKELTEQIKEFRKALRKSWRKSKGMRKYIRKLKCNARNGDQLSLRTIKEQGIQL